MHILSILENGKNMSNETSTFVRTKIVKILDFSQSHIKVFIFINKTNNKNNIYNYYLKTLTFTVLKGSTYNSKAMVS